MLLFCSVYAGRGGAGRGIGPTMFALPYQQRTETVREVFLDYFVSLLRPYRRFLLVPTAETINEYSDYYVEACMG
jgi:hypothetical protein